MSSPTEETVRRDSENGDIEAEHDPHYEPIVSLPLVEVPTNEEDEEELVKIRSRLYRYDTVDHEWKERGTGDIKLLRHKENNTVRVVMRREKTHKVCANHFVTPDIRMNPHCGSDKAFNWSVFADFADETCKQEMLAIRFRDTENAGLWKSKFAEAQEIVRTKCSIYTDDMPSSSSDSGDEDDRSSSSLTDVDTPEPKQGDKISKDEDGVVLQLKKLNVENGCVLYRLQ